MDDNHQINKLHKHVSRGKLAIFVITGFLVLLTYLLIVLSRQVSTQETMDLRSRASEIADPNNYEILDNGEFDLESSETLDQQASGTNFKFDDPNSCVKYYFKLEAQADSSGRVLGCGIRGRCKGLENTSYGLSVKDVSVTCDYSGYPSMTAFDINKCDSATCYNRLEEACANYCTCQFNARFWEQGMYEHSSYYVCEYQCSDCSEGQIRSSKNLGQEKCTQYAKTKCKEQ